MLGARSRLDCEIRDNDIARGSLKPVAGSQAESNPGFSVEVVLDRKADYPIDLEFDLGGDAIEGLDYEAPPRRFRFAREQTNDVLAFTILDDDLVEEDEFIRVYLVDVVPGGLGEDTRHDHQILDDDEEPLTVKLADPAQPRGPGEPALYPPGYSIWLGSSSIGVREDVGQAYFVVSLSETGSAPVTLEYTLVDHNATLGVDYSPLSPTNAITIAPGELTQQIPFTIVNDSLEEPDECFRLVVTNIVNAKMDEVEFTGWILDDDVGRTANEFLYELTQPSVESGRVLTVIGSKSSTLKLRGLAIDSEGNRYLTDHGPNAAAGEGSIIMWPKSREFIIRLVRGLTRPDDIEISPDETRLIYVTADGQTHVLVFGVLVELQDLPISGAAVVYGLTGLGATTADLLPEGFYRIANVMDTAARAGVLDIVVEYAGENGQVTKTFYNVPISVPGLGRPLGERMVTLSVE
jgi:hypothetical protein